MSSTTTPATSRRTKAIIFAAITYALASLYFVSDAITDWGMNLASQHSPDEVIIVSFANMVTGFGLGCASIVWVILFGLIGVALTVLALVSKPDKT